MRAPDVSLLVEHDGEIAWPTTRVQLEVFNAQPGAVAFAEVLDAFGLFACMFKDALIAAGQGRGEVIVVAITRDGAAR